MTSQTVVIEGVQWLTANGSHGNAHARQGQLDQWRNLTIAASRKAKLRPMRTPITVTATVHRTTNAHSDALNVSDTIKACIDGIAADRGTGVIPDDCDCKIAWTKVQRGPKRARPTITLTLEESADACG